jgi:glutaminyl-tRNA synthetase
VAKKNNVVDVALLEHSLREDLNLKAPRVMCVLRPLKLVIDDYPAGKSEEVNAVNNPEDPSAGTRKVPFSGELFIERDDFRETPPPKFYRLSPGRTVRLRYGYLVTCTGVVKDEKTGEVIEVHCTHDAASMNPGYQGGPKAKSTIHWVSAAHAISAEVRLYDRLFVVENPGDAEEGKDFRSYLNSNSLEVLSPCWIEPSLNNAAVGSRHQFERLGYFSVDPDSLPGAPVFNRTVGLRDSWAKIEKAQQGKR